MKKARTTASVTTPLCLEAQIWCALQSASIVRVSNCLQAAKICFVEYVKPIIYAKTRRSTDAMVTKITGNWTLWRIGVSEKKAKTMTADKMLKKMTLTEKRYGIELR